MHSPLFIIRKPRFHLGLKAKLVALILSVSIPLFAYQVWDIGREYNQHRNREHSSNIQLASAIGAAFTNYLHNLWNTELALGTAISSSSHRLSIAQAEELMLAQLPAHPTVTAFSWLNVAGEILASTAASAHGENILRFNYIQRIIKGENNVVSELLPSQLFPGKYAIVVAQGIRRDGKLLGIVIAGIDISRLSSVLSFPGDQGRIYGLVDNQAKLVYRNNMPNIINSIRTVEKETPAYQALVTNRPATNSKFKTKDDPTLRMGASVPVPGIGWASFSSIPVHVITHDAYRTAQWGYITLLVFTLVSLVGAALVGDDLLQRVNALGQAAQALATGERGTRLKLHGSDELAEASVAFNTMAERIEDAESALRDTKDRLASIVDTTLDGIVYVDKQGAITFANPAAERILGVCRADICSRTIFDPGWQLTKTNNNAYTHDEFLGILGSGNPATRAEFYITRPDGTKIIISINGGPMRDENNEVTGMVLSFRDITRRKQNEWQMNMLANHDSLTGLFNRHRLHEELKKILAKLPDANGAVLFLDLDQFKYVNDRFGHVRGDGLLRQVANHLRTTLRPHDILARLGGDEFAFILPETSDTEAMLISDRILQVLQHCALAVDGQVIPVSASIGIALYPEHGTTVEEMLAHVDLAMYQAKEAGRNRYCIYSTEIADRQVQVEKRIHLEQLLRTAIETNRLQLYAQPLLDLKQQKVTIYELLIRMVDRDGHIALPHEFLPIAERTDLMTKINRWVTLQAIELLATYSKNEHPLTLSVNLSARVFDDKEFVPLVQAELAKTEVNPRNLVFEVTETAAIADVEQAHAMIKSLRHLGCRFALDDFGSGFSSMTYLRRLPIDYLKLDGSFIHDLPNSGIDQMLVRAVITAAKGLGVKTVAEFVRNAETVHLLQEYGVDYAQGYYIDRPQPVADALATWYKDESTAEIKGDIVSV